MSKITVSTHWLMTAGMLAAALNCAAGPAPQAIAALDDVVVQDTARGKDLHVKVRFPKAGGPYPVILFSHSIDFNKNFAPDLSVYWASHGYVTIHPSHNDMPFVVKEATTGLGKINNPQMWSNRVEDIVLLLDALSKSNALTGQLQGKLDSSRVGISGHSIGSHTAVLLGGAKLANQPEPRSLADRRISAVLQVFPLEPNNCGLKDSSWAEFKLPLMTLAGNRAWQRWAYEQSPAGDKYLVEVADATYFSFVAKEAAVRWPAQLAAAQQVSVLFWDAYLRKDAQALQQLRSPTIKIENGANAKVESK